MFKKLHFNKFLHAMPCTDLRFQEKSLKGFLDVQQTNDLENSVKQKHGIKPSIMMFIMFLLLTLNFGLLKAQVSTYSFAQSSGSYTPITGGTSILGAGLDDDYSALTNIGFSFTYDGTTYTQFSACSNGFITLGALADPYNYSAISSGVNNISFMGRDAMTGGAVTYLLSGTTGSRVLTIQYPAWNLTYSNTNDYVDVQIQLYETSNIVKIVYGTSVKAASYSAQVGLVGASSSNYNNRTSTTSWSASTAGSSNGATMTWSTTVFPASGQTYTWTPSSACTGTPAPGNTLSTLTSACSGVPFTLSLQNTTNGTGVGYQWQSSPNNVTYTNISSATSSTLTQSQSAATYYRCIVTCSSNSGTSTPVQVALSSPTSCYCASGAIYAGDDDIFNVTLGTLNNTSTCLTTGGSGSTVNSYSNYTTGVTVPDLQQYSNYTLSVTVGQCGLTAYSGIVTAFIDFNQNGSLSDPGELVYTSAYTSFAVTGTTVTGSFTVPGTALTGNTRLRVIQVESSTAAGACGTYGYGETEDYTVNITPAPSCVAPTAQPTALTFSSANQYNISGSFTAASGAPTGYLVLRTLTNAAPSAPVSGTTYTVGSAALGAVVVANGSSTSFTATGLNPATTYYFWVYSYNGLCTGAPSYRTASPLTQSYATTACTISGTKSVGPTGNYASLTAAFVDLNISGLAGPVVLELQSTYNSSVETFPLAIGANIPCISASNTLTIRPQAGATGLSITSSNTSGTINFDGADYVIIDGRPGGSGTSQLTLSNSATSAYTVQFINSATYNTIKYCTISGTNNSTTNGVIYFANATGFTVGNSYNTIDYCDIKDGATNPTNLIYSAGNTNIYSALNNNNTVSNSTLHDWFNASFTGTSVNGTTNAGSFAINLFAGSSDWTITGNSFYQTATRTFTMVVATTGVDQGAIFVNSGAFGVNFTISNNYFGGSAANCGGSAWTYTGGSTGTPTLKMVSLITATGAPSNVSGNTFANISYTTASASTRSGLLVHQTGNINVTNNTFGSQITTGSISMVLSSTATTPFFLPLGTGTGATACNITISNNNLGSINASSTTTGKISLRVLYAAAGPGSTVIITNNTVGGTVANSIQQQTDQISTGIMSLSNSLNQIVSGNTVRNMNQNNTATLGSVSGINVQAATSGTYTVANNTVYNLSTNGGTANFGNGASILGITLTSLAAPGGNVFTGNTVYNLVNTNTTVAGAVVGMCILSPPPAAAIAGPTLVNGNNIHSFTTSSATGIQAGILSFNTGGARIINNFVRLGLDTGGNSITTSTTIYGIYRAASDQTSVINNTVYIGGSAVVSGTLNSYAFARLSSGLVNDTVMNNIFVNARSNASGTGKHYASWMALNTLVTCNNNDLFAPGTGGVLGLYGVDFTTLAAWQAGTNLDWNSISANPQLLNPTGNTTLMNLHVNASVPSAIEQAGATVSGIPTDIDGQARASFTPNDIGADAGNFILSDVAPPVITYGALINTCSTGDRTVAGVSITDATGVPISGTLRPRIYYKKNTGTYYSQPGTLTSGSGLNGVWSFNIVAADMSGLTVGDVVSYYIVAQDAVTVPNIASTPGGAVATDVNTITTQPTTPGTYTINGVSLSGTYNVGVGQTYTTLTAAITAYNTSCLGGPVVFQLMDANYSTSETFPITINNSPFASATNTLTIRPAAGVNATITGLSTSVALIKMVNARYVTIDGVKTGGSYLTFANLNNTSASASIWLASTLNTGPGCNNISILNSSIYGGSNTNASSYGIAACVDGAAPSTTAGIDNDNITIQGDSILRSYYGVFANGFTAVSAGGLNNWAINNNIIGPGTAGANNIGFAGVWMQNALGVTIGSNTVQNLSATSGSAGAIYMNTNVDGLTINQNNINNIYSSAGSSGVSSISAIYLGGRVVNANVTKNSISTIINTNTGGWGCRAIILNTNSTTNTNINLINNFIFDISSYEDANVLYWPIGIDIEGSGSGINVYHNTVNLFGTRPGYTSSGGGAAALFVNSTGINLDVRNNIFSNSFDNSTSAADKSYAIYSTGSAGYQFSNLNNNDYSVSGVTGILGNVNLLDKITLGDIQTGFGGNANSTATVASFVSNTDLHLTNATLANWCMNGSGASISGITTDIDGDTRNTPPDMGADEFVLNATAAATPTSQSICSGGTITPITFSGNPTAFNWVRNNTTSVTGIPANGSGTISGSLVNTTNSPVTVTFTISTIINGCAGPALTATVVVNPLPTFVFTGTPNGVSSGPLFTSFSNTNAAATYSVPSIAGYAYTWSITNGTITAGAGTNSVSVLWGPVNGSKGILRLTQLNTNTGCGATDSVVVSLGCASVAPSYTAGTLALPTTVCQGSTYTYAITPITGYLYKWVVSGGSIVGAANGTSVTVTWGGASTNASVRITDSVNCAPSGAPINITVNATPTAIIAGPVNVCANTTKTYSLGNIVGNISTYSWTATGGTIASGQGTATVSVNWGAAGAGTLIASLTSNLGCIGGTPLFNVNINSNPTATFTGATTVCVNTPYTYTATSTGSTYTWVPTGGAITAQSGNTVTIVWSNVAAASLSLTEAFGTGCTATTSQTITVNGPLNLIASGPATVCANTSATYSLTGAVVTGVTVTNGTVTGGTATTATILWTTPGTGTISITYANGSCSYSTSYSVNINAAPTPTIVGNNNVCTGNTVTYSTAGNTGRTYIWTVSGGGTITSGQGSNSITVLWNTVGGNSVQVNETITATGCATLSSIYAVTVNTAPTSTITGSTNVCSGGTNTYSAPTSGSYAWAVTGGTISGAANAQTVNVVWGAGPAGSVTLTTTNNSVCSSVTTQAIIINTTPTPTVTGPSAICNGGATSFSAGFNSNYDYNWTVNNGTFTAGGNPNTINVTPNTGTTSVTITVTTTINGTTCSGSASKTVTVNPTPNVTLSGSNSVCEGGSQTYIAGGGAATNIFSVVGGIVTSTSANSVTVTWTGLSGKVSVTGASAAGCSASASINVTINQLPAVVIAGAGQACANSSSTFSVGNTGATYLWSATGGSVNGSATGTSATINWGAAGAGTVTCTVTSTAGCSVVKTMNVNVNAKPAPSITGALTVCQNTTQTYSVAAVAGTAYNWNVTGGNVVSGAGTNSITVNWNNAGTGIVTVTQSNGQCEGNNVANVTVNAAPAIPTVFKAGNVLSTNAVATSYQWYNGGTPIAGQTTSILNITTGGSYTVVVTNSNGCTTSSNVVNATVGIKALSNVSGLKVFPNPTNDVITIAANIKTTSDITLNVFDVNGKLVYSSEVKGASAAFVKTIDLSGFATGMYMMQLVTSEGMIQERIIKK